MKSSIGKIRGITIVYGKEGFKDYRWSFTKKQDYDLIRYIKDKDIDILYSVMWCLNLYNSVNIYYKINEKSKIPLKKNS